MTVEKRTIQLINKKFQLELAFFVCSWVLFLGFAYPAIIYKNFNNFVQTVGLDPDNPVMKALAETRDNVILTLIAEQAFLLIVTFVLSLILGHRIAGPLNKLSRYMQRGKEGEIAQEIHFRPNDPFREMENHYNALMTSMHEKIKKASEIIEGVASSSNEETRQKLRTAVETLPRIVANKSERTALTEASE